MSRQEREIELKRANVSQLTAQLNQLKLFLNQVKDPIQKIQDPTEGVQNRPNPPLYVAIAIFVGSIMAGSIALAKDRLEDKVANVDQAVRLSNAPTLGYVPRLAVPRKAVATSGLQALPGRTQDNFRILRSNVLFALKEGHEKTIIVTSTTADEGANGVAANLATTIAASGRSVILVDANLVVASQHDRFSLPLSPGLGEVLAATQNFEDAIAETTTSNLYVLTAGSCHANAGDLLGSSEMESLLHALADKFDVVVIDSPPMTPRSDALALASIADALVYVVKPGATTKTLLKYSLELLGFSRARLLGMVYTDTKFAS
jgi:capsular exopolysaccharide synthesis family protein